MTDYSKKFKECQKQTRRLNTCLEVGLLLSTELSLPNLLDKIMSTAKETMNSDACNLMLLDRRTNELVSLVAMGKMAKKLKELLRIKIGEGIAGWVAETGKTVLINNVYDHPKFCSDYDKKSGYKTRNMICAPLISKGKTIGIAQIINKKNRRKFTDDDLELFKLICSHAAVAIENARLHENLLEKERIEKDLEFARSVQKSFLPYKPPDIKGYSFSFKYMPAHMVGGDFFDFIVASNNKLSLVIGDVSGKGVSAAMFMARVMSDLRYLTLLESEPKIVLEKLNNSFFERRKRGVFVTLLFISLDLDSRSITISNAGHPSPILARKKSSTVKRLDIGSNPPLGVIPEMTYTQDSQKLHKGDTVILFTDGLYECMNTSGEQFGFERIEKVMISHFKDTGSAIESLYGEAQKFRKGAPVHDDLAILSLSVL